MKKLIQALQIFQKYKDLDYPTGCEHDTMYIMGISKEEVIQEDIIELEELGFVWSDSDDCFYSFKYGSA